MPSERKTQPTKMRMSRIAFAARFAQITSVFEVMELSRRVRLRTHPTSSDIVEQSHEPKVHVNLLMAVKQGQARIVGDEIDFRFLIASQHYNVFENSRSGLSAQARQFEAVPVQMDWVNVVAGIAHSQSITLALHHVECSRD